MRQVPSQLAVNPATESPRSAVRPRLAVSCQSAATPRLNPPAVGGLSAASGLVWEQLRLHAQEARLSFRSRHTAT